MWDALKLRKRVAELEETMLKLTRLIEARDLDWQDMRARCKRLLDRTEKAAHRMEEAPDQEPGEIQASQPEFSGLTPHQSTVQKMILAKRRANGVLPSSG